MVLAALLVVGIIVVVVIVAPGGCQGPPPPVADAGQGDATGDTTSSAPTSDTSAGPTTGAPPVDTPTYELDTAGSKVTLSGTAVAEKYSATFTGVTGVFLMNGAAITGSSFELTLDASSLKANTDELGDKLKSEHFLEVERYPTAKFVSTRIEEAEEGAKKATHKISGNLTMHGVLKPLSFPAVVELTEDTLVVKGKMALKRSDFGIVTAGKADDPLKDSFRLELELKLTRKPKP